MANSHKRDANARFKPRATTVAGSLAVAATAAAVVFGTVHAEPSSPVPSAQVAAAEAGPQEVAVGEVNARVSISRGGSTGQRLGGDIDTMSKLEWTMQPQEIRAAVKAADTKVWTTANLNLWSDPSNKAEKLGLLDAGEKVLVTGRTLRGRAEIVWNKKKNKTRWVSTGYFSDKEPFALGGDCTNGTSVPAGVSANIKKVHAAVCAAFPEIRTYGTFRSDGEHAQGIAVDIMVSGARGYQVRDFVLKHYRELCVHYIIYSQHIWMTERQYWKPMENRGSPTANHYDHVHVTVYR